MVKTTKEQRKALKKIHQRWNIASSYKEFRKTVQGTFFLDSCVMVNVGSIWLGIEKDGYTHS